MSELQPKISAALEAVSKTWSFCKMDVSLAIEAIDAVQCDELPTEAFLSLNRILRLYQRCLDFSAHRDDCIPSHVIPTAELAEAELKRLQGQFGGSPSPTNTERKGTRGVAL